MPTSRQILSLDIGSQTVGLAKFQIQPHGGLVLIDYQLREVLPDAAGDSVRHAKLPTVLGEMMDELHIHGGRVNYAAAGQSVFARFVKLPAVEEEKIERIIAFEAQQNVPFPIDEVVWDYQLVGGGADEQIQVVLVAIKTDLLDEINNAIEQTGLRTAIVDIAPMALYNAFRYNYPDLSGSGCSLLVDIGARTTDLLFVEPGKIFSRSVAIGGTSVTAAIAKEFGESFAAAEERKKRNVFVSLGGAYAEPEDIELARASKIVRSTMTRLHAEVMRSISHYRAQQQGSRPERVFLCGGSTSTRYMREFFQEKLQLPVEFLNALRNVAVAESASAEMAARSAHLLGELVGLALRTVTTCPMELNLRPAKVVRRHELEKRRPFFVAAAACVILILLGWGIFFLRAAQVTQASIEQLQPKIGAMRAAERRFEPLHRQTAALDKIAAPLITAVNDRGYWVELLEDLNTRLPPADIWITELIPLSGGRPAVDEKRLSESPATPITTTTPATTTGKAVRTGPIDGVLVRGLYMFNPKQEQVVVDYFRNLIGSRLIAVKESDQSRVIKSTIPNNTEWAFPYELRLDLRKPLPLTP
ncbi:MAG TPA: type IV pilus assembly protein PilM [Chthoniobacterales bacterium]|jgi:type IV pilus assembly protein PilM|nr:type IV pilus assembly protein PilM [Chthoniobacterales bacterium]